MAKININTPVGELTQGGDIYEAGNSRDFKTGDWRSIRPVFITEKCKQCGLCLPVCPDDAIPVDKEGKRSDFDFDFCKGCRSMCKSMSFPGNRNERGGNIIWG